MTMHFGQILSSERRSRGFSQHHLAMDVETTQRHLSFLETGRSSPSREMILRLSDALDLPAGLRADLYEAAGFKSPYRRRAFKSEEIQTTISLLDRFVLDNWPYPAFTLNEDWDLIGMNAPGTWAVCCLDGGA